MFLGVDSGINITNQWMTKLKLNLQIIKFKIDTGADVTVIPSTTYDLYYDGTLHHTKAHARNELKVHGWFEANFEKGKDEVKETVYVVGLQTPLAGIPIIGKLNLTNHYVQRNAWHCLNQTDKQ